ncbi:MAG: hypothetical protein QOD30_1826 [Actinomycetota bacterium]|nr:hypothetical protein [Actinomycetota bacterium]
MLGRRLSLALTVALVGLSVVVAPAAHADTVCVTDQDGQAGVTPAFDAVETCVTLGSTFEFRARMAQPTDPNGWPQSAYLTWTLDRDHDGQIDGYVSLGRPGDRIQGAAMGPDVASGCQPPAVQPWTYDGKWVSVRVAGDCFGGLSRTWFNLGTTNNQSSPSDYVPASRVWAGPVTRPPAPTPDVTRLAGSSRIATAIAISKDAYADGAASSAVLASSANYPDALVGVPLAAAHKGPMLLNPPDALDPATEAEVQRVTGGTAATVYLLGGEAAISSRVADRLRELGYAVVRYGGANRFATAVQVADALGNPAQILEATGRDFPDALGAGAAATSVEGAVLLTNGTTQAPETAQYLQAHPPVVTYAIGGAASKADPSASSIAGRDRYETSTYVANMWFGGSPNVGMASGVNYPDALAGGAHIVGKGGGLLLTAPGALPDVIKRYLKDHASGIGHAYVYGGSGAVNDPVLNEIQYEIT